MDDPFGLRRFLDAQDAGGTYERALAELRVGRKVSHWMWFVFPQLAGLGRSSTARTFAISGIDEARAYLDRPVLGERLRESSAVLLGVADRSAVEILGEVDAMKLRSCMTLFAAAAPDEPVFRQVLERFFAGAPDPATEQLL